MNDGGGGVDSDEGTDADERVGARIELGDLRARLLLSEE